MICRFCKATLQVYYLPKREKGIKSEWIIFYCSHCYNFLWMTENEHPYKVPNDNHIITEAINFLDATFFKHFNGRRHLVNDRSQYYTSKEWNLLRNRIINNRGNRCEGCGKFNANTLHHITYDHFGCEFDFELLLLCENCHKRLHSQK